jgi:hypothetical protein
MSLQRMILPESSPKKCCFRGGIINVLKKIEDSKDVAKNNVAGVENNYKPLRSEEKEKQK